MVNIPLKKDGKNQINAPRQEGFFGYFKFKPVLVSYLPLLGHLSFVLDNQFVPLLIFTEGASH